jgi:hypothetical protein
MADGVIAGHGLASTFVVDAAIADPPLLIVLACGAITP